MRKFFLFLIAVSFVCLINLRAEASTYTVTTTNDSGQGSLRSAIILADQNGVDDTILFSIPLTDPNCDANAVCTINLTSGSLTLNSTQAQSLTILNSTGAEKLRVSGNNTFSIFQLPLLQYEHNNRRFNNY